MSIVITTPTGHIGTRVTQLLIQAGVKPTLLARNPAKLSPEVTERSEVRQGNLNDEAFVLEATTGADALLWLIPTDYTSHDPEGDILRLGQIAATAVRQNGIEHVVLVSSQGAESRGGDFIGALGQVEDLLAATDANVVFLRPGFFFTNLFADLDQIKQGVWATPMPLDVKAPWNDPRDVAEIAAARLLNPHWSGKIVQPIGGPRDLSYAEVAQIINDVAGIPVQALKVTDDQARDAMIGAGMPPAVANGFVGMSQRIAREFSKSRDRSFEETTPRTIETWVFENLK